MNRLCKLLGIEYPIIQGAMLWLATPELAAAVSEAGGLGIIAASNYSTGESLRAAIQKTKSLTGKPFAVNLSLLPSIVGKEKLDEYMDAILAEHPPVVETSGQSPKEYLPRLQGEGLRVMHKVPSVRFALKAQELGVDAVTVVGYECGGHPGNGEGTSMVQIRRAAQLLSIPLVAGGGIADGAGLAAALSLGADGVVMGTRFIAARECVIHPAFQQALCAASEEDTVLVQRSIGTPLRVWKNAAAQRVLEMESQGASLAQLLTVISGSLTKTAYEKGDVQGCAFPVGQCAGLIDSVIPAGQIIRDTVAQARELLDRTGEKL